MTTATNLGLVEGGVWWLHGGGRTRVNSTTLMLLVAGASGMDGGEGMGP